MKTFWKNITVSLLIGMIFLLTGCLKNEALELLKENNRIDQKYYGDFDFETTSEYDIELFVRDNIEIGMEGVYIEIYPFNPLDEYGNLARGMNAHRMYSGITSKEGRLKLQLKVADVSESIYLMTYHIGLPVLLNSPGIPPVPQHLLEFS